MANRVKLIHKGSLAVTSVAVAEALAVCVQSGVNPYTFYDVVRTEEVWRRHLLRTARQAYLRR